jgi:hypothetical protein
MQIGYTRDQGESRYRAPAQHFVYCRVHSCAGTELLDALPYYTTIRRLACWTLVHGPLQQCVRGNGEEMWRESSMTWSLHIVPARAFRNSGDAALCRVGISVRGPQSSSADIRWPSLPTGHCSLERARCSRPDLGFVKKPSRPQTLGNTPNAPYTLPRSLTDAAIQERDGCTSQQPLATSRWRLLGSSSRLGTLAQGASVHVPRAQRARVGRCHLIDSHHVWNHRCRAWRCYSGVESAQQTTRHGHVDQVPSAGELAFQASFETAPPTVTPEADGLPGAEYQAATTLSLINLARFCHRATYHTSTYLAQLNSHLIT